MPEVPAAPQPAPESAPPSVRVRLFASLRDTAGWSERLIPLPPTSCTPLRIWQILELDPRSAADTTPCLGLPPGLRVAINQRFAAADTPLQPGDELAFLPPITGG